MDIWSRAYEYPKLRQLARRLLVLFRSIYVAESAFYNLKYIKINTAQEWLTKIWKHPSKSVRLGENQILDELKDDDFQDCPTHCWVIILLILKYHI